MRGGRFPDSSTYCLDFSMGGRNSQTIAFSQLSKALCHKRFSPDATFWFSAFSAPKTVSQRTCTPLNPLQHKGLRGSALFLQIWIFFEIISCSNLLSPAPGQRENFLPDFEEKYTWHCLLWRHHFSFEWQNLFPDETPETCSICPIIAQKTSVSISAAFSTWENMTFRGKIFYIQKMPLFEPEMPKTRTNAAKKFSAKGAVTSRQ